uniref:CTP synthase (glutamine hydrolyzing) n=1 Tax=viral metagenome TaxID=1070528 RepID=A0A6C0L1U7_9ZZZZ|tara:strand:+ start:12041 stop:13627 length:1587 start_codon:yes stop_codon:yes gene_type:complete
MTNYIFVTGGVISGLGKGVTSASIGAILQMLGETKVTIKKLDPYLNIDPGTMNPIEHGEVFVTDDGSETDLDLGYYERFLEMNMKEENSTSSGKLFQQLLEKERKGCFLGKTVQMIPHFTNIIKEFICSGSNKYDYIICEIGGSIGDIEAMAFYEALRQLKNEIGSEKVLFIHLTYLVYYSKTKELKTKPTQNTIRDLQHVGIYPDILVCRTEHLLTDGIRDKLSMYTSLPKSNIIEAIDVSSIYQVPLCFIRENLHSLLSKKFMIQNSLNTEKWSLLNNQINRQMETITIGILGKYTELNDSYKSLIESISHAGIHHGYKVNILWINAKYTIEHSSNICGVIVPGGFGTTGIEEMVSYIKVLREKKIPTFGICLGLQLMVIEFSRNVLGFKKAGSSEFNDYSPNVIIGMEECVDLHLGGTMRLGSYKIQLNEGSKACDIYGTNVIFERHRHRYMVDNLYSHTFKEAGFNITGRCSTKGLIEVMEMETEQHPWYLGCQYHPEYLSSPFKPHPLFVSYIQECIGNKNKE